MRLISSFSASIQTGMGKETVSASCRNLLSKSVEIPLPRASVDIATPFVVCSWLMGEP